MISSDLKNAVHQVEQCVDDAVKAMQSGQASEQLRDAVNQMHEHARRAKQQASSTDDDAQMSACIMQLEQSADRAIQACRSAGNLTPQVMQVVQSAHDDASKLKKRVEAAA